MIAYVGIGANLGDAQANVLREFEEHVRGVRARPPVEVVIGGEPDALERAAAIEAEALRGA